MKKLLFLFFLLTTPFSLKSQGILSLDSCRALAIANNKELLISGEKINAAHYQKKAAFTNYLPNFSATGAYMRNQKEFSLLNNDQKAALSGLGTSVSGPLQQAAQVIGQLHPELAPMLSQLGGAIVPALNEAGTAIVNKKKLAESYLKLLQKLDSDVEKMIAEGVATKADGLSVRVKVNEAEMTLTKVEDGLSLSRMLLCQLCGIDLSTPIVLADEQVDDLPLIPATTNFEIETAYANRPEIRSLELAAKIYQQKINVTRSEHLPSVALMGNYMVTNPSVFNSFENKFKGMWNVGVMVQLPIWHWGEGIYKVKAAKAEARIAQYQLEDAKEKIELQVNQSAFKVNEAAKKLAMAKKNLEKADENLRYATLGFEEGVIAPSNVLEAHTAWLSAQSEKIDAQIDVKLTEIYLQKSLGTLK